MSRPFLPQVLTANRLRTGDVVYLGGHGAWVTSLADAAVAGDAERLAALERTAVATVAEQHVVAVYAIDVTLSGDAPQPTSVKERIRAARGPSI